MDEDQVILRKILAAFIIAALAFLIGHTEVFAQQTKAQLNTYNNTVIVPNGVGEITAANLHPLTANIIAAMCSISDPLSCPLTALGGSTVAAGPLIGAPSGGGFVQGSPAGSTTVYGTVNGTLTNGDCVSIDSGHNFVDAGGVCTVGGGGGTVSAGTAGQLAGYASSGTVVVGFTIGSGLTLTGTTLSANPGAVSNALYYPIYTLKGGL